MGDCTFCGIVAGEVPASVVYRGDGCTSSMDTQPINRGHVLVILDDYAERLSGIDGDAGADAFVVGQRVAAALYNSGVQCEGVNLVLADGEAAGQKVFHTHLHVIPRFGGDGFGFTFGPGYSHKPGRPELDAAAERIRGSL